MGQETGAKLGKKGNKAARMRQRNREKRGDVLLQGLLLLVKGKCQEHKPQQRQTAAQSCNRELNIEESPPYHNQKTLQYTFWYGKRYVLCAYIADRRVQSQVIVHVSIAAPLPPPCKLANFFQPPYKYAPLSPLSNLIEPLPSIIYQLAVRIRSCGV